jgi:hypothetical protein
VKVKVTLATGVYSAKVKAGKTVEMVAAALAVKYGQGGAILATEVK